MTAHTLDGHMGTSITIDVCLECQSIWFDTYESLQLAPGSTLKLFQLIGEQANRPKAPMSRAIRCPRCESRLLHAHDRQRDTPFEYWRCDQRHGRFITFFNFLREKNFVRAMSPAQIDELRKNDHSVHCSNCGAPVDIVHRSACAHCGSPLSMLDMHEAGVLIEKLRQASVPKPIDPALPLNLLKARQEAEAAFALIERNDEWWHDASQTGVVEASLSALARWLNQKA
jgi:hypothetical protein